MKDSVCVGQRNDAGDERVVLFLQVLHADGLCRNDVDFGRPKISKDDDVDNQDAEEEDADEDEDIDGPVTEIFYP